MGHWHFLLCTGVCCRNLDCEMTKLSLTFKHIIFLNFVSFLKTCNHSGKIHLFLNSFCPCGLRYHKLVISLLLLHCVSFVMGNCAWQTPRQQPVWIARKIVHGQNLHLEVLEAGANLQRARFKGQEPIVMMKLHWNGQLLVRFFKDVFYKFYSSLVAFTFS